MNKTLNELELVTFTYASIFEALSIADEVNSPVVESIEDLCPTASGVFTMKKISSDIAKCEFVDYSTNRLYIGIYAPTISEEVNWLQAWTKAQEDLDDTTVEADVERLKEAFGDTSYLEHYGLTLVEVLNKYTRQVLQDSSTTANHILIADYYGDIEEISYNTPLLVQIANDSITVTDDPTVTFEKEIWEPNPDWDPEFPDAEDRYILTDTETSVFPLKVLDIDAESMNEYTDIAQYSMTKNVFYTLIRRETLIEGVMTDIFVLLSESSAQEYQAISLRLDPIEAIFSNAYADLGLTNITIATLASIAALTVTGNATIGGTLGVTGATTLSSSLAINGQLSVISGTSNSTIDKLTISNSINLASATITIPSNPTAGMLVPKSYVDTQDTATYNSVKSNLIKGGTAVPTTGVAGSIYIQY